MEQIPFWVKRYVQDSTDEHWIVANDGWECTHEFMRNVNPGIERVYVSQDGVMTYYDYIRRAP